MKVIVWDVDDVLNDLMKNWLEWFRKMKNIKITYDEITENPPHKILNISLEEYQQSLDKFRLSEYYQKMPPVKEVFMWFEKYGHKFRHIALTATPLQSAPSTAQWVLRHFGKWIRTFHFVPSKRNEVIPEYEKDKSDFFKWFIKADVFIDDNPENVDKAKKVGINAWLWKRPWNRATKDWNEILNELIFL